MTQSKRITLALVLLVSSAASLTVTSLAAAVDPYDGNWHFSLTPYVWLPNINGSIDTTIPGRRAPEKPCGWTSAPRSGPTTT